MLSAAEARIHQIISLHLFTSSWRTFGQGRLKFWSELLSHGLHRALKLSQIFTLRLSFSTNVLGLCDSYKTLMWKIKALCEYCSLRNQACTR